MTPNEEFEARICDLEYRVNAIEDLNDAKGKMLSIIEKHLQEALAEILVARIKAEKEEKEEGITDAY